MSFRHTSLICVLAVMAGCGSAGNVIKKTGQVLMDPSIPVGAPGDQPTQYTLSLYAGPDVNPNPNSAQPEGEPAAAEHEKGKYVVTMSSDSRIELAAKLMAVLEKIRQEEPVLVFPGPLNVSPAATGGTPYLMQQGQSSAQGSPALGQYSTGAQLSAPPEQSVPSPEDIATPIALKVLQLKDDSLFLSADWQQLEQNPKDVLKSTYLRDDDYILQPGQFKFISADELEKDAHYLAVMAGFHNQDGATWKQVLRVDPVGRKYAVLITLRETRVTLQDEDSHRWQEPSKRK